MTTPPSFDLPIAVWTQAIEDFIEEVTPIVHMDVCELGEN